MAIKEKTKKKPNTAPHRLSTKTKPSKITKKLVVKKSSRGGRTSKTTSRPQDESDQGEPGESTDNEALDTPSTQSESDPAIEEYTDHTLNPETLRFLKDLAKNNHRDWFHGHKDIYKIALADFKSFSSTLQEELTKVDWTVPILPLERHNLFRIHRDVRFSNSKVPYKEYFSVAFSRTGKQGHYAKYYLSIQPGDLSFIGGGLWHPEATHLSLMRREIDRNPRGLKDILVSRDFFANFLDTGGTRGRMSPKAIENQAVNNFLERNSEGALKTAPKGYDREHDDIDLLRLKSYTVGKRIKDSEVLLPNSMEFIVDVFRALEPFITYLNSIVMPDPGVSNAGTTNGSS
ncbi:hypothetical protein TWF569_003342 [Orbilia oligospora]|uniref:TIGR02453 family protein n=1 Tax=Orbilia oligospora TaxID=2813651 RepID=A0A7C8NFW5_ORBOL|nr:hypothetical protein TWF706_004564 [Orbilia oligospora]KAF3079372.1 hypothetical protein TWF102_002906 [Orbilia oligospora]KAF3082808.1 hypothetical protein TWF103_003113 [Orbilia oligospora]KAF3120188.1 hypothetical protein TWF569_003342 [Orbilia oligospora]KAF3120444.1 hypothetical protein TWF703_002602 [Orbilia oligospora]